MKLYSYVLDGTPLTQIPNWTINMLGGNAPFIVADVLPPGDYVDVSSIENWQKYGRRANKDYKFVRNEIKLLVNSIGWASLTDPEKEISVRLFVVDESLRSQLHTIPEQVKLGFRFHALSVKIRGRRWSIAEVVLMNRLPKADWREVWNDINQKNLVSQYIENGLEGTIEGDPEGLFDYLDARSGTAYGTGTKGFRNKNFTPIIIPSMDMLANAILSIVKDGNY